MKRLIGAFFLVFLFVTSSFAYDDEDFQIWNTDLATWKVSKNWKISLEEEFYYGDNARELYYQHSDLGVIYSGIAKWFDAGFNYRQVFEKREDDWKSENRIHFNGTLKWKILDLSFSDRSRFEYRIREDADDFWRYRNKLVLKIPLKMTKFKIQPYTAYEIFYDFNINALNKNCIYGGLILNITKNLKGEVYYARQSYDKEDKWAEANVLGINLKVSF